jgi:hypothetical protein
LLQFVMVAVVQAQLLLKIYVRIKIYIYDLAGFNILMVTRKLVLAVISILFYCNAFAQYTSESTRLNQLSFYQDSLKHLGNTFINDENDLVRKNANYQFIKTLVIALKTPNSFLFPFDSVKTISIINSPDNKFRIFSWHVTNNDGSYRFYGAVQMNTGGNLKLYGLEDYSPLFKNPEDSVTDNHKWFGAQYYAIVPVYAAQPYYVLLGWKGNTVQSTKKVIDAISFRNDNVTLGMPVFDGNGKKRKRVVFEYTRQASMLLKYIPAQHLIVFDNLAPPDKKLKDKPETYGPDLSYNGYRLKDGRWEYIENLDMRNVHEDHDAEYIDPKSGVQQTKALVTPAKKPVKN